MPDAGSKWLWSAWAFSETMSGASAPDVGSRSAPAPSSVAFVQVFEIADLFAVPEATVRERCAHGARAVGEEVVTGGQRRGGMEMPQRERIDERVELRVDVRRRLDETAANQAQARRAAG